MPRLDRATHDAAACRSRATRRRLINLPPRLRVPPALRLPRPVPGDGCRTERARAAPRPRRGHTVALPPHRRARTRSALTTSRRRCEGRRVTHPSTSADRPASRCTADDEPRAAADGRPTCTSTSRSRTGAAPRPGRRGPGRRRRLDFERRARARRSAWSASPAAASRPPAALITPAARADRRHDRVRGRATSPSVTGERAAPAAPRDPDDLPGPVRLAEPAAHRRRDRRRRRSSIHGIKPEGGVKQGGPGAAGARRPEPRALQPLPARVLRRPAPAHRHRPRARPASPS